MAGVDDARERLQEQIPKGGPAKIAVDQGPTSEMQVEWAKVARTLGLPYQWDEVPLPKLYKMRNDSMISFGLQFVKVPLVRAPWYIDGTDAQINGFVDSALRRIWERFVLQYTNCLDFGYAPIVKRFELDTPDWTYIDPTDSVNPEKKAWDNGTVPAVVWKSFSPIAPEKAAPIWASNGQFGGFRWGPNGPDDAKGKDVKLTHALWATNMQDSVFGSPYGMSRLLPAYNYWWSYWFGWTLSDRAFEKHVDPAMVVYYPPGDYEDEAGQPIDMRASAIQLGQNIRSGSTIAVANERHMSDEKVGDRLWEFEFLKNEPNFQAMRDQFSYLDVMKLRSILVPEQSLIEGGGGTSSRNVASQMADMFTASQMVLMAEIVETVNRYMIPQLVAINFPDKFKQGISARMVTRGFSSNDSNLMSQVIQLVGQAKPDALNMVDLRELMNQAFIPTLSPMAVQQLQTQQMAQAAAQAAATAPADGTDPNASGDPLVDPTSDTTAPSPTEETNTPTDANPIGGGQTQTQGLSDDRPADIRGVIEDGKYIQQRERIVLSAPAAPPVEAPRQSLKDQLAAIPSMEEQSRAVPAERMNAIWKLALTHAYMQASDKINVRQGAQEVALEAGKAAAEAYGEVSEETLELLLKMIFATGSREAQKLGQGPHELGEMDGAEDWAKERVNFILDSVAKTTEDEVQRFLASGEFASDEEAAAEFRKVVADKAEARAKKIAFTEGRNSVAVGQVLAARALGVTELVAGDASDGTNKETDQECLDRDGKVFSLDDALEQIKATHPNCTLHFRLMPPHTSQGLSEDQTQGQSLWRRLFSRGAERDS